jgi:hypothetical protein
VDNGWPDDDDGRRRGLAVVIRKKILPLLLEYFYDDWRRADAVLGATGLLDEVTPSDETEELLDDHLELDEVPSFAVPDWWNPQAPKWDGERFRDALN